MAGDGSTLSVAVSLRKPASLGGGTAPPGFGPGAQAAAGGVTSLTCRVTVWTNASPADEPLSRNSTLHTSVPPCLAFAATVTVSTNFASVPLCTVAFAGANDTDSPGSHEITCGVTSTSRAFRPARMAVVTSDDVPPTSWPPVA